MALTHNKIANAKPASRDYKLFDSKGLFLIVSPAGGKSWRFKYRFGERERLLTLGKFPELGVEVLRIIRMITGSLPILFPSAKGWRQPMSDAALSTMYKRMAGGRYQGQMVPHGWRSSFSTIMNERAAELERDGDRMVIDMILAHVPEGVSASEWVL